MLSAKLFEERLVFIDSEELEHPKTTFLKQILEPYGFDKLTFLTGENICGNFSLAARNISNLNVKNAQ